MKKIEQIILILILLLGFSCGSTRGTKTSTTISSETLQSISGKFVSEKGVMVRLSCYCYDCGYLTTENGQNINVCFKAIASDSVVCPKNVTLIGNYENIKINPESGGVCSAGVQKIFMVESVKCKE